MAEAISDNNQWHVWTEIDKVTPSSRLVSSTIDGADSNDDIAEIFADKFELLCQNIYLLIPKKRKLKILSVNECKVTFIDLDIAIKKLNLRKGDDNDGFSSDHIILLTNKFETIIVMLINCMLIHDHNTEDLLASVIE